MAEWGEGLGWGAHHPALAHSNVSRLMRFLRLFRRRGEKLKLGENPWGRTGPLIHMTRCSRRAAFRKLFLLQGVRKLRFLLEFCSSRLAFRDAANSLLFTQASEVIRGNAG
jgi:hypothetical protein